MNEVQRLRAEHRPTVPSTLAEEKATNPFFRADQVAVKESLQMPDESALAVFTEVRRRKDVF